MSAPNPSTSSGRTDPARADDRIPPAAATDAEVRWLDDGEQLAWRNFLNGTRRLQERLDQDLKAHGLNNEDYGVLVALSEADGQRVRMAELAAHLVQSRSRLSHHIARLEGRHLVGREACPDDRRGQFAILTAEGRRVMETTAPHHVKGVREHFLDHISAEELAVLGEVFARIDGGYSTETACDGVTQEGPHQPS